MVSSYSAREGGADAEPKTPDGVVTKLAAAQYGNVTRLQALECGLTRHQITARLASGIWTVVHPKVYRIGGAPETRAATAVAGRLYAGDDAWFSHASAARLHGIDPLVPSDRTWLTVPAHIQRPRRPGLVVIRSRRITGFTDTVHDQPVLNVARTIVDLAGMLSAPLFMRVLYDVFGRGLVGVDEVLSAAENFGGRAGLAMLHHAVEEFDPAFESGLEHEADDLFRGAGFSFERQFEIRDEGILIARLDFADEENKIGIEIDGARFHSSQQARSYDRQRDRSLARRGWRIERFTTDDVRRHPKTTVRHIHGIYDEVLRSRTPAA
ncbi:DUF559 domain-containing protein [Phytoactinopolyspora halotolerans]|uniref:DUF559 domain-containing protein n=1 Tax=Phytoactinopolyspora halotolerans TaxID=1981512 RepID=A0A6L9SCY9_9ACTN|nr:DUF559 domain-containing protein [Phytoactinopolyspora halotolerans]NEE03096.1 DUF559 domain-containing protein [Phytoactinopolyspora halotolerans]